MAIGGAGGMPARNVIAGIGAAGRMAAPLPAEESSALVGGLSGCIVKKQLGLVHLKAKAKSKAVRSSHIISATKGEISAAGGQADEELR